MAVVEKVRRERERERLFGSEANLHLIWSKNVYFLVDYMAQVD